MSKSKKILITGAALLAAVIIILPIGLWYFSIISTRNQINNQLHRIISMRNTEEINKVSLDNQTQSFLMNLPQGAIPSKTSGNQGGELTTDGYVTCLFATVIENRTVDVYVKVYRHPIIYRVISKIKVYKLSVDGIGTVHKDGTIE